MSSVEEKVRELQTRASSNDVGRGSKEAPHAPPLDRSTTPPNELFRRDAIQHAAQRVEGAVILTTPMAVKTVGIFLSLAFFACITFAALTTYARKATVSGYLVPDQGMIRATTQAPGTVQPLLVHEDQVVAAGDHIAVLGLSPHTYVGGNAFLVFVLSSDLQ